MMMDRNEIHILYHDLIESKRITHTAVSADTKVSPDSLRQFKKNGSIKHDKLVLIEGWLRDRGFTQRDNKSDIMREIRDKLAGCVDTLDNADHPRGRKARILLNQLKILVREYGAELEKIGLQEE